MKTTPLSSWHTAHGAKLVDFAGWLMPLQFSGVLDEYHAVRQHAGLFDVSHMGRLVCSGKGALPFLQYVTTNDVERLAVGDAQYSMVCNVSGGVKDDVFVYRTGADAYLVCVNASNREKIVQWFHEHLNDGPTTECEVRDVSSEMMQIALQGPESRRILSRVFEGDDGALENLKPRRCLRGTILGHDVMVTRTGYTGELGFELYGPASSMEAVWTRVHEAGQPSGLQAAGLGARDLLRLDMGYFLYGHELDEDISPVEAGASWAVQFSKPHCMGMSVLRAQRDHGTEKRLAAFELLEKAVPRQGMQISRNDTTLGTVTSGNLSPVLQKGIGMGYIMSERAALGDRVTVHVRGRAVPATLVKTPFYRQSK